MNGNFCKVLDYTSIAVSAVLSLLLFSCAGEKDIYTPENIEVPLETIEENSIYCNVFSIKMDDTKALVESDANLQNACSATGGKGIGIWSAYKQDSVIVKNVLGNSDGDVCLVYREGTTWDNYRFWTYSETATKWVIGAEYTFYAYYPMHAVDEITTSDITTFVLDYNTEQYQEDLMAAYAFVNTKSTSFIQENPIQLEMKHTLAAIKFRFSFINRDGSTYKDSDALTAFWLENTVSGKGIATTGILAFGTLKEDGTVDGNSITWYHEDHPEPSNSAAVRKIYEWEDAVGVDFSSTETSRVAAVAYSTDTDDNQKYAVNDGWLLIIPQETDETVQICFKLKTTGELVHRINLPATIYEAGKRYTYDIRFGRTSMYLTLKIAAWNELQSSYDISM